MINNMISILIPVYNVERYVELCIQSVLKQNYTNYEIIIIFDGSTDKSEELCRKLLNNKKNVSFISRENKGILYTRIEAIKYAAGEYIMFLDSDDWLEDDALEILVKNAMDADIVRGDFQTVSEFTKTKANRIPYNGVMKKEDALSMLASSYHMNSIYGQLIKKEIIGNINLDEYDNLSMGDDLLIMMQVVTQSRKIVLIDKILYNYRLNEQSITHVRNYKKTYKNLQDKITVYATLYDYLVHENIRLYKKKAVLKFMKEVGKELIKISVYPESDFTNICCEIKAKDEYERVMGDFGLKNFLYYGGFSIFWLGFRYLPNSVFSFLCTNVVGKSYTIFKRIKG